MLDGDGGGYWWWMPMHVLSAWDGTPIVDAHAPVGIELANIPPKATKNCNTVLAWRVLGSPRDLYNTYIAIDPVQRRWRCLPVGVTWGPPHLHLVRLLIHHTRVMGKVKVKGCQRASNYSLSGTPQVDGYIVVVDNESDPHRNSLDRPP